MYKHILVPLDGSRLSEAAVSHAETLAKGCGTLDITLLRVVERTEGYRKVVDRSQKSEEKVITEPVSRRERDAGAYINRVAEKLSGQGLAVYPKLVIGDAAQAILYHAEHSPCEIIVMASHGRSGLGRWALGSVADKVVRASTVPVLLVGPREKVGGA